MQNLEDQYIEGTQEHLKSGLEQGRQVAKDGIAVSPTYLYEF